MHQECKRSAAAPRDSKSALVAPGLPSNFGRIILEVVMHNVFERKLMCCLHPA
jgi:hypothetical protein